MSDNYYASRLRWHGRSGAAKLRGRSVQLVAPPDLGDGAVNEIEYTPELGIRRVRRRACDAPDDMRPDEVSAADRLLIELTKGLDDER